MRSESVRNFIHGRVKKDDDIDDIMDDNTTDDEYSDN